MENQYPGLKPLLSSRDLSMQGQSLLRLRTAVHQRREQTINKEAKTAGTLHFVNFLSAIKGIVHILRHQFLNNF